MLPRSLPFQFSYLSSFSFAASSAAKLRVVMLIRQRCSETKPTCLSSTLTYQSKKPTKIICLTVFHFQTISRPWSYSLTTMGIRPLKFMHSQSFHPQDTQLLRISPLVSPFKHLLLQPNSNPRQCPMPTLMVKVPSCSRTRHQTTECIQLTKVHTIITILNLSPAFLTTNTSHMILPSNNDIFIFS